MAVGKVDKAAQLAALPMRPDEDPFIVAIGGFYRRWFNLVDDLQPISTRSPSSREPRRGLGPRMVRGRSTIRERGRSRAQTRRQGGCAQAVPAGENVLQPRALSRAVPFGLADLPAGHESVEGAVIQ